MANTRTKRLNVADWLEAGFDALRDDGPEALKAEPMARRLSTTKGSFYWHFTDVPAYHAALLAAWEIQASTDIIAAAAQEKAPVARLRRVAQMIARTGRGGSIEPSLRAWARGSDLAAQALARVDAKRLAHLKELLGATGIGNPEMARLIYAASIGMEGLNQDSKGQNSDAIGSLVDLILALR